MESYDNFGQNLPADHSQFAPELTGGQPPRKTKGGFGFARQFALCVGLSVLVCAGSLWAIEASNSGFDSTAKKSRKTEESWIEWIFGDAKQRGGRNRYRPFDSTWEPDEYEVPEFDYGEEEYVWEE